MEFSDFMQNSAMATPPDKSKPADPRRDVPAAKEHFLDPLPVPDATESNTDTAWGLWEHTLRAHEDEIKKEAEPDFQDTVPFQPLPVKKP
jgi:hypothetical protein